MNLLSHVSVVLSSVSWLSWALGARGQRDRQVAGALADRRRASHRARPEALDRRPFVGVCLPDDRSSSSSSWLFSAFATADSSSLLQSRATSRGVKARIARASWNGLAPQVPAHHPRLARRGAHVAGVRANDPASRRLDAFRSAARGLLRRAARPRLAAPALCAAGGSLAAGSLFLGRLFRGGGLLLRGRLFRGSRLLGARPAFSRRASSPRRLLLAVGSARFSAAAFFAAGFSAAAAFRLGLPAFFAAAASFAGARLRRASRRVRAPSVPPRLGAHRTLPEPA